jgi:carboxypeptidase Taq
MFLAAIEKDLGNLDVLLSNGQILKITEWIKENIHQNGSFYTSAEVIQRICGCPVSAKPLLDYFTQKYTALYNL